MNVTTINIATLNTIHIDIDFKKAVITFLSYHSWYKYAKRL